MKMGFTMLLMFVIFLFSVKLINSEPVLPDMDYKFEKESTIKKLELPTKGYGWVITKTGEESNLEVTYTDLSTTSTRFCIEKPKDVEFTTKNLTASLDLNKITVHTTDENIVLEKTYINLSISDTDCFVVNYDSSELFDFKIGENSIHIERTTILNLPYWYVEATDYPNNENDGMLSNLDFALGDRVGAATAPGGSDGPGIWWFGLDFGDMYKISNFAWYTINTRVPTSNNVTLQGSNDNSTYVNVTYLFTEPAWGWANNTVSFPGGYRYYRVWWDLSSTVDWADVSFVEWAWWYDSASNLSIQFEQPISSNQASVVGGETIPVNISISHWSSNITDVASLISSNYVSIGGTKAYVANTTYEQKDDMFNYSGFELATHGWELLSAFRSSSRSAVNDSGASGGTYSINMDGASVHKMENTINASGYDGHPYDYIYLSWWYYGVGNEAGDCYELRIDGEFVTDYGTASCENIYADNSWHHINYTLSPKLFTFDDAMTIGIWSSVTSTSDDAWIDGFNITGYFAYKELDQIGHIENGLWTVNITMPEGLSGDQDMFLNLSYLTNVGYNTCTACISYAGGSPCDCPTDENWILDCSENCDITSNCEIGHYNLTLYNSGYFYVNANVSIARLEKETGCKIVNEENDAKALIIKK